MTQYGCPKYVGVPKEDLLNIYILYIHSLLDYSSVVWHSTINGEQSQNIERVQKLCLKVILGDGYEGYESALESCELMTLSDRREDKFGLKCLLHTVHSQMFPVNPHANAHNTRSSEHFTVNWAKSDSYSTSAVPYIQRLLNEYVINQQK